MKVYFNGWFSGFMEKTNAGLNVDFFLELFEKVYSEKCFIGSFSNSDILCEFDMLLDCNSLSALTVRTWRHTYLFSGESTLKCNKKNYTCVLWGERNHENVINVPLFIPYIYTNHFLDKLESKVNGDTLLLSDVPAKDVCVVVSNAKGFIRNKFLNKLEKVMRIDYAGGYKNNMNGCIPYAYNTPEFLAYVSQYKFIISMENSREDTYITEKVIHGLLAKTIPVYWGSKRIYDYINKERILALLEDNDDAEMDALINQMQEIANDNGKWREMVLKNVFPSSANKLERNMNVIARDIRCLLSTDKCWKHISRIYCISNPLFEPERCIRLQKLFQDLNIGDDYVSYISPTYKHTITDDIYNKCVKQQLVLQLRNLPMKRSEISLFYNYKAVLEDIEKNYKDGLFYVFESDILLGKHIEKLNDFMDFIVRKKNDFDLIHMGITSEVTMDYPAMHMNDIKFHKLRELVFTECRSKKYIEDITSDRDKFRVFRKFYTRCNDAYLWNYKAIKPILNYMNNEGQNFGYPLDHYLQYYFEQHIEFKHYWTLDEFFFQGSNLGIIRTNIQNDIV
jgi:hypothetical protein